MFVTHVENIPRKRPNFNVTFVINFYIFIQPKMYFSRLLLYNYRKIGEKL